MCAPMKYWEIIADNCLATQKPPRGEARRLIARLGCVIDPAALRIVENDLRE